MAAPAVEASGIAPSDLVLPARRRRRLPFSPWHLVLIPATIILIFPFAWLLITSVETPA
jgi:multiple sugar transport system permease protein